MAGYPNGLRRSPRGSRLRGTASHSDDAINTFLDREGARLCAYVTTQGDPSAAAEGELDAMAVAFEARFVALDRAAAGAAGTA